MRKVMVRMRNLLAMVRHRARIWPVVHLVELVEGKHQEADAANQEEHAAHSTHPIHEGFGAGRALAVFHAVGERGRVVDADARRAEAGYNKECRANGKRERAPHVLVLNVGPERRLVLQGSVQGEDAGAREEKEGRDKVHVARRLGMVAADLQRRHRDVQRASHDKQKDGRVVEGARPLVRTLPKHGIQCACFQEHLCQQEEGDAYNHGNVERCERLWQVFHQNGQDGKPDRAHHEHGRANQVQIAICASYEFP
ncbi:hypothetical protein CAOG_009409 [Capsaspora owczarzaki ATCC 30864]|uniref:Uncharacterized protein n=1 Tax=Capsaspora owczarzaki (strain ATCC 30864) TaxID=595528 RepID=A0A0D2WIX3_CAPO3|nr:hypothetical protein CAOG_009409 [Capsaspora owczarzaki ATCC 30864]